LSFMVFSLSKLRHVLKQYVPGVRSKKASRRYTSGTQWSAAPWD
jgi:hypothetical protein